MGIDVMVSDEMQLSRLALIALLKRNEEIQVVNAAEGSLDALEFAEVHRPDVAIISFEGQDNDAITLAEKIASLPECRSLLLSTGFSRSIIRQAFTSGIDGMVQRSAPPRQFFEAIHRVHQGERVFDPELTVAALGNAGCPLSSRELAVLEHVAQGDTVGEIAAQLHLSEGTVRNYVSSVVAKLGARNRIDALLIARNSNWI